MINISDSARDRLFQLLEKDNENNSYVRVGVESGGCSGLSYKLDFDNTKHDDDELIEDNNINFGKQKAFVFSRNYFRVF